MKTLGKALVALMTALAAIGLHALPAPANDVEITSGQLDMYASDSTLMHTYEYGNTTNVECSSNDDTFEVDSTGAWSATFTAHTSTTIAGTPFTMALTATFSGTSSTTGAMTGTGTAQALFYPRSATSCAHTGLACTFDVSPTAVSGTSTVTDHEVEVSDEAVIGGDNGEHGDFGFELSVTGTGCGAMVALDDGSLVATGLTIHATT